MRSGGEAEGLKLADFPQYIPYAPYLKASETPLCLRFVGPQLLYDSTTRIDLDGAMWLRVFLRCERHNASFIGMVPVKIRNLFLRETRGEFLDAVNDQFWDLVAQADYQLAAYCASNLWC